MKGCVNNYDIHNKFELIAYNESYVVICHIKPQFNSLNYNEILLGSIFGTHLCYNTDDQCNDGSKSKNYDKFNNKKIISCVFTLDRDEPYLIGKTSIILI
jgi:hypothetical protein